MIGAGSLLAKGDVPHGSGRRLKGSNRMARDLAPQAREVRLRETLQYSQDTAEACDHNEGKVESPPGHRICQCELVGDLAPLCTLPHLL